MTVKEYISEKLSPFGQVSEAQFLDLCLDGGFSLEDDYTQSNAKSVGVAMVTLIEELILLPRMSSVNENGFSASWNLDGLSKYYLLLCKKYGITPNTDVVEDPMVFIGG